MGIGEGIIPCTNAEAKQPPLGNLVRNSECHEKQRHTSNNKETFQPRHRQCIYLCVLWSFLSLHQFDNFLLCFGRFALSNFGLTQLAYQMT